MGEQRIQETFGEISDLVRDKPWGQQLLKLERAKRQEDGRVALG